MPPQLWLCPLLAYLVGSVPFGLIIAKIKGIDIREHGSGNIGATNVFRIVGKKYGIACLLLDALKGFIPVVIALNLVRITGRDPQFHLVFLDSLHLQLAAMEQLKGQFVHVLTAIAAVLGHNYSPWLGFKGGKGIATSAGVLIALMPAAVVILLLVFIITLTATRYVSVASMVSAASLPLLTLWGSWHHGRLQDGTWNKPLLFFSVLISGLAIWKHRANILRLRQGTESRLVWGGKKKSESSGS